MGIFTQSRLHTYPSNYTSVIQCHIAILRVPSDHSTPTHALCAISFLLSLMSDLSYALDNLLTNYPTRLYQSYILYSLIKPYMTYMTLYIP